MFRQRVMAGYSLRGITALLVHHLVSSSLVFFLIFVASKLDGKFVTWSIMSVDERLYRNTALLSA